MKEIKGYEGLYSITSCGKVWSHITNKFLTGTKDKDGYLVVNLTKDKSLKQFKIHRLVAETYIPNPLGLTEVNHKDEIKIHNFINNLMWISHKDNVNYGTRTKRAAKAISKPIYCIELNKTFESVNGAARELNINAGNLTACLKGRQKTCGGYHWQYEEVQ